MIKIGVILTCHNRKAKTLACLRSLFYAKELYNNKKSPGEGLILNVFVTDDGCTDGTPIAIRNEFVNQDILILTGDGSLFWAGGMRLAWKEALKHSNDYYFFLLLNDDTILLNSAFDELFETHSFCQKKFRTVGLYSGITNSIENNNTITYGGYIYTNCFTGARKRLGVSHEPQLCDCANANIMLVPCEVVNKIGIFYDGYVHSSADFDYSFMAKKKGIPVLITKNVCGSCNFDHQSSVEKEDYIVSLTQHQRKEYFMNPLHSGKDYITFVRRNQPIKYPLTLIFRWMNLYLPRVYYWLNSKR